MSRHSLFIGRFSPFHNGHDFIIRKALDAGKKVLLAVMDTPISDKNPWSVYDRVGWLSSHYCDDDLTVIIIPPIESVNIGRNVGYDVNEIEVPEEIASISATEIRAKIDAGDPSWADIVPDEVSTWVSRENTFETLQRGAVIWLTGLPCAGKTTLAKALKKYLAEFVQTKILDADFLRVTLCEDLGFSPEDKKENNRRVAHIAREYADDGHVAIVALVSPTRSIRKMVKKIVGEYWFYDVFVDCSLEECMKRDVKGMYAKAKRGEIEYFIGVDAPYESPLEPFCAVKTDKHTVDECVKEIVLSFRKGRFPVGA